MSKEPGANFSGIRACSIISSVLVNTFGYAPNSASQVTHSIYSSSQNVENALSDEPRQPHLSLHLRNAKCLDAMENGEKGAQAHSNEHECAERSPGWSAETWEQNDHHCRCADRCDLCSPSKSAFGSTYERMSRSIHRLLHRRSVASDTLRCAIMHI